MVSVIGGGSSQGRALRPDRVAPGTCWDYAYPFFYRFWWRLIAVICCLAFFLNQSPLANEVNHAEETCR